MTGSHSGKLRDPVIRKIAWKFRLKRCHKRASCGLYLRCGR